MVTMDIPVHNLTSVNISVAPTGNGDAKATLVPSTSVVTITVVAPKTRCRVGLLLRSETKQSNTVCEVSALTLSTRALKGWALIHEDGDTSTGWRVYLLRREVGNSLQRDIYILPCRDLSCFLRDIEDTRPLSDLCLPSTHDSLSLYGWPISQCQSLGTPFATQLQLGIRVVDVRMAVAKGRLVAHHGIWPERTPFQNVLSIVHEFLSDPATSSETVIMSIKQEDAGSTPPADFSKLVRDEIYSGPGGRDMWFLENRIPQLGEVRGKVIMLSRFGGDGSGWENGLEGMGIHPTTWPDSQKEGFQWTCKDTLVRTSDWYDIPSFLSIPEKVSLATTVLLPPTGGYTQLTLNVSFLSAASFPLALPPVVAKGFGFPALKLGVEGVNARVGSWLLVHLTPSSAAIPRGWVFMDYFKSPRGITSLLVECNFRAAEGDGNAT